MKVYIVREDTGWTSEPYYSIVGVYKNEQDANKAAKNTRYDVSEWEVKE